MTADNHSTDPKWKPSQGGLPEARFCTDGIPCWRDCPPTTACQKKPTNLADAIRADRERLAEQSGATECAREVIGWTSPTAGTITPPPTPASDDLPAAVRWRLELFEHDLARLLADIRVALGKLP